MPSWKLRPAASRCATSRRRTERSWTASGWERASRCPEARGCVSRTSSCSSSRTPLARFRCAPRLRSWARSSWPRCSRPCSAGALPRRPRRPPSLAPRWPWSKKRRRPWKRTARKKRKRSRRKRSRRIRSSKVPARRSRGQSANGRRRASTARLGGQRRAGTQPTPSIFSPACRKKRGSSLGPASRPRRSPRRHRAPVPPLAAPRPLPGDGRKRPWNAPPLSTSPARHRPPLPIRSSRCSAARKSGPDARCGAPPPPIWLPSCATMPPALPPSRPTCSSHRAMPTRRSAPPSRCTSTASPPRRCARSRDSTPRTRAGPPIGSAGSRGVPAKVAPPCSPAICCAPIARTRKRYGRTERSFRRGSTRSRRSRSARRSRTPTGTSATGISPKASTRARSTNGRRRLQRSRAIPTSSTRWRSSTRWPRESRATPALPAPTSASPRTFRPLPDPRARPPNGPFRDAGDAASLLEEPVPSLWLVDGSHAIFRAYHALPHLSTRQGVPTNAVYGFTTMLLRAIREGSPTHLAVAFDEEAKAARAEIYSEYKATRGPPPDDLMPQFPLVRRVLEVMRIPAIGFPGYEADDVIATLAVRARAQGWDVVIVSGDKDLLQLVVNGIRCYDSMYEKWYGPAEVEEKWGVSPTSLRTSLALTRDKIDNIPGVPGVGEKTAAGLLKEYGTLENVLANAPNVKKPKLRENLIASIDKVRIGRRLIALYDELPLPVQLEDLERKAIDEPRARSLFTELEFVRLLKDLPRPPPTPPTGARRTAQTVA